MFQLIPHLLLIFFVVVMNGVVVMSTLSEGGQLCYGNSSSSSSMIEYPFWSKCSSQNSNEYIGYPGLLVNCEDDGRLTANFSTSSHRYYVQGEGISGGGFTLTVVDVSVDGKECPQPRHNFSFQSENIDDTGNSFVVVFYNCSSGYPADVVQHFPCGGGGGDGGGRSFAFREDQIPRGFDWYSNCKESVVVPVNTDLVDMESDYGQALRLGFQLKYSFPPGECVDCELGVESGQCIHNKQTNAFVGCLCPNGKMLDRNGSCNKHGLSTGLKILIGLLAGFGGILIILLFTYRRVILAFVVRYKNIYTRPTKVETFLETFRNLTIERYTYSGIKRITNSFKEPIGEGGYGYVFKGKLDDGSLVAVKVLNESKGDGEDFINEVTTISRTNHVNVVRLLGFCSDGIKRALVYEFMSNGSLERFVYSEKNSSTTSSLGWETLYQIALGIARGLEYLHCRCNTRIVHFDIKPHNILLDKDFCPKISDFGLAKLCPTIASVVSVLGARGTIGYIAPEVYCRNFGGASHKSDVYSYGMMMLEMIGGRKNIDTTVENSSEIYFPQWIYNHLKQNNEVEVLRDIFQQGNARKMIIISLWCIQTQPANRPSINKVVEMLEGNIEDPQMPPNPFQENLSGSSLESSQNSMHF